MIALIGWLAALLCLVTSLAMLKDTHIDRGGLQRTLRLLDGFAWRLSLIGWESIDFAALVPPLRFALRNAVLVLICASSGMCVLLPLTAGLTSSLYEVLLRCCLAAFLAMQAPCPLWRYLLRGHNPASIAGDRHVQ